jgi:cell division protein ZapA (FtsZ GTPase activity inhibitor)
MMQENDLKTITVTIAGRNFPLKVTESEEGIVTDLVLELNTKVNEFQTTYPSRDKLDCVIMTLLTYTFDQKNPTANEDTTQASSRIDAIKGILNGLIK